MAARSASWPLSRPADATGRGSHRQFIHPKTGRIITVSVHTKKEVGTGLAARILKEAGL
jgi:predicted RNA binding protein YcfA (HicA-like mRNA interferase family)